LVRPHEAIRFAARRPLALVVSAGGDGTATVREALARAGFAEESALPAAAGWDATASADLVVLDGENVDVEETLVRASEAGRLDPGIPVLVSSPGPVASERQLSWLRAGAWEVVATPADAEALSLFVTNLVRGRRPAPGAVPEGDMDPEAAEGDAAPRPAQKEPYSWRPLVRVTEETLSLARRHHRPVACLAFVPVWREPDSASAPMLLANRLARTLLAQVRGSDLVGISDHGAVLAVLPDTDTVGGAIISRRLLTTLRDEIRAWGMVAGIQAGQCDADRDETAAGFLLRAVGQAG
jgi:DNA-binding response OmpR family regulator